MDALVERTIDFYRQDPLYWGGITVWILGFAAYLPAACGRGTYVLSRTGAVLCWLGFGLTLLAHFMLDGRYRVPPLETPTLTASYWHSSSTQIWLLWIIGSVLIVASWLRWLTPGTGWLGLTAAMVGVVASWPGDEGARRLIIATGSAIVIALLLVRGWRGELRRDRIAPGDYEAELVALCRGSTRKARRLIRDEMTRQPALSRAGAALAAVTRLRHERAPYPPPL